jgi:hypothetical protein
MAQIKGIELGYTYDQLEVGMSASFTKTITESAGICNLLGLLFAIRCQYHPFTPHSLSVIDRVFKTGGRIPIMS